MTAASKKGKATKKKRPPKTDIAGTFLIGGCEWTLRFPRAINCKALREKGKTTLGLADPNRKEICVVRTLGPQDRHAVLLHEVIHAIAMEYGHLQGMASFNACEHSVDSMAKEISSFMRQMGLLG